MQTTKRGFTLIELLIVIAILGVLAAAVTLVLNPAELLAQSRDSQRISDLDTIRSAINSYLSDTTSIPPNLDVEGFYPQGGCSSSNGTSTAPFGNNTTTCTVQYSHAYVFTSSGTWTAPPGVTSVTANAWGGGGGGGSGSGGGEGAGGGGGGAFSQQTAITVIPGNVYTVTVGQGGAGQPYSIFGGTVGNGGDSSFISSSTVLAKGGLGGNIGVGGSSGLASAGVGTTKYSGGNGGNDESACSSDGSGGGGGGAGTTGNGANGVNSSGGPTNCFGGAGGAGAPLGGGAGGNGGSILSGITSPGSNDGGGGSGLGSGDTGTNGGRGEVDVIYTTSTLSKLVDGTGWVDVNFQGLPGGSPLAVLPIDPINSGFYTYAYVGNNTATSPNYTFKLATRLESTKFKSKMNLGPASGTTTPCVTGVEINCWYQVGTDLNL